MLKVLTRIVLIQVFLLVALILSAQFFLLPHLKPIVESRASQALGCPVTIGEMKLDLWPPIGVVVRNLNCPQTSFFSDLNIQEIALRAAPQWALKLPIHVPIILTIQRPSFLAQLSEISQESSDTKTRIVIDAKPPVLALPISLAYQIQLEDGQFDLVDTSHRIWKIDRFSLQLNGQNLYTPQIQIKAQIKTLLDQTQLKLPIAFSGTLGIESQKISLSQATINVADLMVATKGYYDLSSAKYLLESQIKIPDLSKTETLPGFLPPGKWRGSITGSVRVQSNSSSKPSIQGSLSLDQLVGDVHLDHEKLRAEGIARINGLLDFYFVDVLKINRLRFFADASAMKLSSQDLFQKPPLVPMVLSLSGQVDGSRFSVNNADLKLGPLELRASGIVDLTNKKTIDSTIEIKKTLLVGLEKFFIPLAPYRLNGAAEARTTISGQWNNFKDLVSFTDVKLYDAQIPVRWLSEDKTTSASGFGFITLSSQIQSKGAQLLSAQLNSSFNLQGLKLSKLNTFTKPAGLALSGITSLQFKQGKLRVDNLKITSYLGSLTLAGLLALPKAPEFELTIKLEDLRLGEIRKGLELAPHIFFDGSASSLIQAKGQILFENPINSPMTLVTNTQFQMGKVMVAKKNPSVPSKEVQKKIPLFKSPLLPQIPLVKNLSASLQGKIAECSYDGIQMQGLQITSSMKNQRLGADMAVQSLFGGKISKFQMSTDLSHPDPMAQFVSQLINLSVSDALSYFSRDWGKLMSGRASGELKGRIPLSMDSDNMISRIKLQGQLQLSQAELKTLPFKKMILERLEKLPQLGALTHSAAVIQQQPDRFRAESSASFSVSDRQLKLSSFVVQAANQDEVNMKGSIDFNMMAYLTGAAFITNSPFRGTFQKANSDGRGRLMVPFTVADNILAPRLSIAQETIQQMLAKTVQYEANSQVARLKKQANETLNNEMDKGLNRAKKSLKDLLDEQFK